MTEVEGKKLNDGTRSNFVEIFVMIPDLALNVVLAMANEAKDIYDFQRIFMRFWFMWREGSLVRDQLFTVLEYDKPMIRPHSHGWIVRVDDGVKSTIESFLDTYHKVGHLFHDTIADVFWQRLHMFVEWVPRHKRSFWIWALTLEMHNIEHGDYEEWDTNIIYGHDETPLVQSRMYAYVSDWSLDLTYSQLYAKILNLMENLMPEKFSDQQ